MDYNTQVHEIAEYIGSGEKDKKDFKIGVEIEHFVIDRESLKTVSYYGEDGVGQVLKALENQGWEGIYEGDYILGLKKGDKVVSLEPGSQLELSLNAKEGLKDLEVEYLNFLRDLIPVLDKKNYGLIATAYHPETKIDQIKLLPKGRYDFMFNYFKTRGKNAHNMMKGTASLQISIDYSSEEDYKKKFKVANGLGPVLHSIMDNGYYFEGGEWGKYNLRTHIWNNCDSNRCGLVEGALDEDFSYKRYAQYILNRPAILIIKEGKVIYTGDKLIKDIFDPDNYKIEELDHLLTMFFPDARTKKYIEIRMMDAIPYPLNFAAVALIKGIFYSEDSLNKAYEFVKDLKEEDIIRAKTSIIEKGLEGTLNGKTVLEIGKWLVKIGKEGLEEDEKHFILPLEEILKEGKNPYEITRERLEKGKKEALDCCILNHVLEEK